MTTWVVRLVTNACALAVAAWIFGGIVVFGPTLGHRALTLIVVALIFGIVNAFVRPVVAFFSFPFYLLTLGLMYFVVNALMLLLTSWLSGLFGLGFHVDGFWTALLGALVISVVGWLIGRALPDEER